MHDRRLRSFGQAAPAWLGPGWVLDSVVEILTADDVFSFTTPTDTAFANVDDPDLGRAYAPPLGTKLYTLIEEASGLIETVYVEPTGRIITGADLVPGVAAYTSDPVVAPEPRAKRSSWIWWALGGTAVAATVGVLAFALAPEQKRRAAFAR